ncbi:hypothetical protein RFI_22895 [Reticulomyxa filosa]|uniref:Protein kinase domain-containing protein n=1 Tax=Reticulomyxa filosa TaxID=46433 RepID=X6MKV9_RETFI|nr:hypothetical protein RFI_22895 [Reticulomyxa filosa]|eukprot:ETO14474.1 hypothetical protein RFI_22895 [Reticulomyxa filosa]
MIRKNSKTRLNQFGTSIICCLLLFLGQCQTFFNLKKKRASSQPNQPMSTRAIKKRKCSAESWEATKSDCAEFFFDNETDRETKSGKRGYWRNSLVSKKKVDDQKNRIFDGKKKIIQITKTHSKRTEEHLEPLSLLNESHHLLTKKENEEKINFAVASTLLTKQLFPNHVHSNDMITTEGNVDTQAQLKSALVYLLSALLKTVNYNKSLFCDPANLSQVSQYSFDDQGYIVFVKGLTVTERYQLLQLLGQGTFSKVFIASDLHVPGTFRTAKITKNLKRYQKMLSLKNVSNNFFFYNKKTKNTYNKMIAFFKNEKQ